MELGSRLIPFHEGWQRQREVHGEVAEGRRPSTLLLVEHEPVYTVGRRAHSWERPSADIVEPGHVPVVDVDRGGKTTWHGPGQLTVYPILRLAQPIDVIRYVRALEAAVIDLCGLYGLETIRVEGRSGVWLPADPEAAGREDRLARPERKICALGGEGRPRRDHARDRSECRPRSGGLLPGTHYSLWNRRRRRDLTGSGDRPAPVDRRPANALVSALENQLTPLVADTT